MKKTFYSNWKPTLIVPLLWSRSHVQALQEGRSSYVTWTLSLHGAGSHELWSLTWQVCVCWELVYHTISGQSRQLIVFVLVGVYVLCSSGRNRFFWGDVGWVSCFWGDFVLKQLIVSWVPSLGLHLVVVDGFCHPCRLDKVLSQCMCSLQEQGCTSSSWVVNATFFFCNQHLHTFPLAQWRKRSILWMLDAGQDRTVNQSSVRFFSSTLLLSSDRRYFVIFAKVFVGQQQISETYEHIVIKFPSIRPRARK